MTVAELIERLQEIENKDRIVVMAIDEEGNGYKELSEDFWECNSIKEGHERAVGIEELTEEYEENGYSEDDVLDGEPTLVIGP